MLKKILAPLDNDVLINLQEEQLSILKNKPKGALLTQEDVNKMSYGSKVLRDLPSILITHLDLIFFSCISFFICITFGMDHL